jgi:transposase
MKQDTLFIGLDVHKETIAVAVAEGSRGSEVRFMGTIVNNPEAIVRLVTKLAKREGELRFCYEAGPCGYAIHRQITKLEHECIVVAPSLTPIRPGDRVKTDRRDAVTLARLHRADELTAVWVPDEGHEAMRDLVRLRTAAMEGLRRARQQLQGFLLRQNLIFTGGRSWTKRHRRWLATLTFDQPAHRIVLQESIDLVDDAGLRLARLEQQIADMLPRWSLRPVVNAIQAMRGVSFISAVTVAAETGDLRRFDKPRQFMSYLGLVPSEHSSGARTLRGGITKAGNKSARRMLIEGAWAYRMAARVGPVHQERLTSLPKAVREIAWKAQLRLCSRYRRLAARGKPRTVVTTAIAREMAAFIWAIARHVQPAEAA